MADGEKELYRPGAEEGEARLQKKPKQEQPLMSGDADDYYDYDNEEEEEEDGNPLDPMLSEYDPKQRRFVYTRYFFAPPPFDLVKESPAGPMRFTDRTFREDFPLTDSANVASINIVSSDYGYPINVYGSVIIRDCLDTRCIYIFRRDKDNCQLVNSKDDALILTGPKRGLKLCGSLFFEVDLRIKNEDGSIKDDRVSKGLLELDGVRRFFNNESEVGTLALDGMHSIVEIGYTLVRNAVEGTIEIRILEGPSTELFGKIIACTTSTPRDILLHDTKVNGILKADDDDGVIQMARRVMGVSEDEMLVLTIAPQGEFSKGILEFTPRRNSYDEKKIVCAGYKMQVKVTWSVM